MFGVAGLYKHPDVVFSEIVIAVGEEGSVSLKLKPFHRHLKGWEQKNETVTSRFIRASGNTIWFDGLTFRRREGGCLQGFVAIRHKDGTVKESFPYRQVKAGQPATHGRISRQDLTARTIGREGRARRAPA